MWVPARANKSLNQTSVALSNIDASWLRGLVSITLKSPKFDQDPVNQFFRHLRNAIAHVRFEVNDLGDFSFWDQKNENEMSPRFG
jgi:hypothetical protein